MLQPTALDGGNAEFLDALYEQYLRDPSSVAEHWRSYFARLGAGPDERAHGPLRAAIAQRATQAQAGASRDTAGNARQAAVSRLIQVWINRGHLIANIDPLGLMPRPRARALDPEYFGLSSADLDQDFFTGSRIEAVPQRLTLRQILAQLREIYAGPIGAEFAHISNSEERLWLQDEFQQGRLRQRFTAEDQHGILWQLTAAEGLERYLHTRYVGQKRFSLEGTDALIPLLDDLVQRAGAAGVEDVVIGMAHRGRLNVLVNLLGKSPAELFSEFEGAYDSSRLKGSGDVKYHKGFSADLRTTAGNVHTVLAFNPSHLEVVDPVVEGSVRARQERRGDAHGERVLPLLIHGDAAFAGQGVVMETLQLSQARGFFTGGTVHVIVNNQIGFTTSPMESRSTPYATDVAKGIQVPIFHVNGDHPEAVAQVVRLAMDYRKAFHSDVVIDMYCYRKYGHNEADEPSFTQPLLYQKIEHHPSVRTLYAKELVERHVIDQAGADAIVGREHDKLNQAFQAKRSQRPKPAFGTGVWQGYRGGPDTAAPEVPTAVAREVLEEITTCITTLPEGFRPHRVVAKLMANRAAMGKGEAPLDWGMAEHLAFGSLVRDGHM
ncbi:MAG: 2-oxoglutarate dehydrogenase E1 component, partial [Gammaproteobacteria bacterium]|nr:2-oxoglutarate dehydrogenase E1 component [Gammaproteobacteria bacterium]